MLLVSWVLLGSPIRGSWPYYAAGVFDFAPFKKLHRNFWMPQSVEDRATFKQLVPTVNCLPGGVTGANHVEGLYHPQFLAVSAEGVETCPEQVRRHFRALSDFAVAARAISNNNFVELFDDLHHGGELRNKHGSVVDLVGMRILAARPAEDVMLAIDFVADWMLDSNWLTYDAMASAERADRLTGRIAPAIVTFAHTSDDDGDPKYFFIGRFLEKAGRYTLLSAFMQHAAQHLDPDVRAVVADFEDCLNPDGTLRTDVVLENRLVWDVPTDSQVRSER